MTATAERIAPPAPVPEHLEAELAVLGALLLDPEGAEEAFELLTPEHFTRDAHRQVFRAMLSLQAEGKPIDVVSLQSWLAGRGELERAGGSDFLVQLLTAVPTAAHVVHHAGLIRDRALERRLLAAGQEIQLAVRDRVAEGPELAALAERVVLEASGDVIPGRPVPMAGQLLRDVVDEIDRRISSTDHVVGIGSNLVDLDELTAGWRPGHYILLGARPSEGKAQPLDARVLTPSGYRRMGELDRGDVIIGADGHPHQVTGVYPQGSLPIYRVILNDGSETRCTDDHLWFTSTRRERKAGSPGSVRTLSEIRRTLREGKEGRASHHLPTPMVVHFAEAPPLELNPYVLGLLLGDGDFSGGARLHNPEPDIRRRFADLLPPEDTVGVDPDGMTLRVKRRHFDGRQSRTAELVATLGLAGADAFTKFIPSPYLVAGADLRTGLLRGLLDTDGHVGARGNAVEYTTVSERLAADIVALVRSLGGIVQRQAPRRTTFSYRGERRTGAPSHRMVIRFPGTFCPVNSVKHLTRWKGCSDRMTGRWIQQIEPVGQAACQCISIDAPDGLYLTDDCIPTHNTALSWYCAQVAAAAEHPVLYVSLEMSREELVERALARMADIPLSQLHRGKVSDRAVARIVWAQSQMQHWALWIDDAPDRTISSVRAVARRYRRQHGIALVVVDYVQLLRPDRERENEVQNVRAVSAGLKAMARDLGIPVLVCSQLNRTPELAKSDKPKLAHLRESGALEQDADVVVLLWRNPQHESQASPPLTLILAKQRNGPRGEVKVAYDRATGEFTNYSERDDAGG